MGLCRRTNPWTEMLWDDHEASTGTAQSVMREGGERVGRTPWRGFAHDLAARLYLPDEPEASGTCAPWATQLHDTANQTEEWTDLRRACASNGFLTGVATETLLHKLAPVLPQLDLNDKGEPKSEASGTPNQVDRTQPQLRKILRQAARAAQDEAQEAADALSLVSSMRGGTLAGTGIGKTEGLRDMNELREVLNLLHKNKQLERMLKLAGRMLRAADKKPRAMVDRAAGELHGIERGSDVQRLLPTELLGLAGPPELRALTLCRLVDKQTLQYGLRGREALVRGDMVVLIDQSDSMDTHDRDTWAKAVGIACAARGMQERRHVTMLGFAHGIKWTLELEPSPECNLAAALRPLLREPNGGTSFADAVAAALRKLASGRGKRADVVLITDGEDSGFPGSDVEQQAQEASSRDGVSWFVVGVDVDSSLVTASLSGIATTILCVRAGDVDEVACVVNTRSSQCRL